LDRMVNLQQIFFINNVCCFFTRRAATWLKQESRFIFLLLCILFFYKSTCIHETCQFLPMRFYCLILLGNLGFKNIRVSC
jgi:hypothetical protein